MRVITVGGSGNQCQKPSGWLGRLILRNMNARHSAVTDWGLAQVSVASNATVLDVGCGGGRTVAKLASMATTGKVHGIDFSPAAVRVATKVNRRAIEEGRVDVREASVSHLPFPDATFDLATAVETHFWWPDPANDMREILRVLKPGGTLLVIAEIYKGAQTRTAHMAEKYLPLSGMKLLTVDAHRELLAGAGCTDVRVSSQPDKGWICCIGSKP